MNMQCVRVQRHGRRWGVTQSGMAGFVAEYESWEDAVDHARGVAAGSEHSIVEGEDLQGRLALRQLFRTDDAGVVHVSSLPLTDAAQAIEC